MKSPSFLVIAVLASVALGSVFADELINPWFLSKDTGNIDAVVLEISGPDLPPAQLLVREGEYATARFGPDSPILGLKASSIGLRGKTASIDVYRMDHLMSEKARASQFVEQVELDQAAVVLLDEDVSRLAGRDGISLRLVGVKLASR